jgi:hypothetical protein
MGLTKYQMEVLEFTDYYYFTTVNGDLITLKNNHKIV